MRTTSPSSVQDSRYIRKLLQYPNLSPEEEELYVKAWRDKEDRRAWDKLINSHMKLVVSIAKQHTSYGFPLIDLITEGSIGLMTATNKFDPDRGFHLSTYATWWIRATIREYVLENSSLVKMGTTGAQKKLFFNLKRLKSELNAVNGDDLTPEQALIISIGLNVPEQEVHNMNRRLNGDSSLNAPVGLSGGESTAEKIDLLKDDKENHAEVYIEAEEKRWRLAMLREAIDKASLSDRSRDIFARRQLREPPDTLEQLSGEYHVSRERVRQIEVAALKALTKAMRKLAAEQVTQPAIASAQPLSPQEPASRISDPHHFSEAKI